MIGFVGTIAAAILCCGSPVSASGGDVDPAHARRPALAILGASASAGFGVLIVGPGGDGPGVVGTRLSEIVLAIDEPPPVVVRDWSTASFFTNPLEIGPAAVRRCLDGSPDAILAIDFLFWFAYGAYDARGERLVDEAQRDELFEVGLSLLDPIEVPMLIGDLPDVRGANPRMLSRWQVPSVETLARLNARLRAWAEAKPHVRIFPLAERTRIALEDRGPPKPRGSSGGPREERDTTGEPAPPPLLQRDRLHPTFEGLVQMAEAAIRAMDGVPGFEALAEAIDAEETDLAGRVRARILAEETASKTAR